MNNQTHSQLSDAERKKIISKSRLLARLARPQNTRLSILLFAAAGIADNLNVGQLVVGSFTIFCLYATANSLNDLADVDIDRANNRNLPLAAGALGRQDAKKAGFLFLVLSLIGAASTTNVALLATVLSGLMLGVAYSWQPIALERRGLLGTLCLSLCYVGIPIALAWSFNEYQSYDWKLLLGITILESSVLLFKDFKDERGDRAFGKRTPLVRYGQKGLYYLAAIFFILGCITTYHKMGTAYIIGVLICAAALALLFTINQSKRGIYAYNGGMLLIAGSVLF
ncbi:MAG TPA: UbiA family prenyltransferase [Candidatus Saccharimonadales bacterium]